MGQQGIVYLMAGAGAQTGSKSVRFHQAAVDATGKKKPRIAYIGAASGDSLMFEKMIVPLIFGLKSDVVSVRLSKKKTKTSEAKEQLAGADLIFVSGGDVEEGMRHIHERDLAPFLRELHAQGKVFEGVSAGSIMLGMHWVRFEDHDDASAQPFDCLGIVPHSFDAHDEKDGWGELQTLARLLAAKPQPPSHVYGLPSGHCGLWDGKNLKAMGGPLHRFTVAPRPERAPDLEPES